MEAEGLTVEELKQFLREHELPLGGTKKELQERVWDYRETRILENELGTSFADLVVPPAPRLDQLPQSGWKSSGFPVILEEIATSYLRNHGGYTKNYRTGVKLCQSGHIFSIEVAANDLESCELVIRAKCRPTMKKVPAFYQVALFINGLEAGTSSVQGANCECPAGETQSCVHVAALLLSLVEISPTACTSLQCLWSRPANQSGKPEQAINLDFGLASLEGYTPYTGPKLEVSGLITSLEKANVDAAAITYRHQEEGRVAITEHMEQNKEEYVPYFVHPLSKLEELNKNPSDMTTIDLISALTPSSKEEVLLIAAMTEGQRLNPLWLDARQWRLTASNYGRVCNRKRSEGYYPPSLLKWILGDYGRASGPAIHWGVSNESVALETYEMHTQNTIRSCGVFISLEHPFLAASPDGIAISQSGSQFIVEVKCPYKHRNNSIAEACKDKEFCLEKTDSNSYRLKRGHDYYYQVTGQLAITGADFCDFVVWTSSGFHQERICLDQNLWKDMLLKLKDFYHNHLGPEILSRLVNE